ncbi:hypothetical protein [Psychrobacter sp. TB55-MNA-CIBAN-0194]|uniref:hypothetical protein n=1 Tax=Psychrobacter sp. TB55-MNA-CIBAN-0194 TaxID=3140445 RepID=UPI003327D52F
MKINSKSANVFFSFLLPTMFLIGCSGLSTNIKGHTFDKNNKPFYLEFDSLKADSLHLIKHSKLTMDKFELFCDSDDFTVLPNWSIYDGEPIDSIANLDLSHIYLTFDDRDRLQKLHLIKTVSTEDEQKQVYDKIKKHLDQNYRQIKPHPLRTLNMTTNEVIRNEGSRFYTGWSNYDIISYKTKDGYLRLNKGSTGTVKAPAAIRSSTNGIYADYANIGNDVPEWKDSVNGVALGINVDYFSNSFSDMYDKKCS